MKDLTPLFAFDEDPDNDGQSVTVNLRFPGQYYDAETGLYYNWHRYYEPSTGRYVTSDPIGLVAGLNIYSYAAQNPLYWVDPLGLFRWPDYVSFDINIAIPNPVTLTAVGINIDVTLDRNGNLYLGGGGSVGESLTMVSGSLVGGVDQRS